SCGALDAPGGRWPLGAAGLACDRLFMLRDVSAAGRPVSLKRDRRLALVRPVTLDPFAGRLVVDAPGMPAPLEVEFPPPPLLTRHGTAAFTDGPKASAWFTRFLGYPVVLVMATSGQEAPSGTGSSSESGATDSQADQPQHATTFQNDGQFLLVSETSYTAVLEDLPPPKQQQQPISGEESPLPPAPAAADVDIRRFRANFIIGSSDAGGAPLAPFAEEGWGDLRLRIGDAEFQGLSGVTFGVFLEQCRPHLQHCHPASAAADCCDDEDDRDDLRDSAVGSATGSDYGDDFVNVCVGNVVIAVERA
ncbi:hypothetical protein HK405_015111, partial [Cladochytrium tenue]